MSATQKSSGDCGCCEGTRMRTPASLENRSGLTRLRYRVGTHARFLDSMKTRLSSRRYSALTGLTTREADDPSIALLDSWAMVLDILSFYQERIANEAYLQTATERQSILEMARSIGYELKPGVAAGTWLAFTLEDAEGSPGKAVIPEGTQVQSVPEQDELPQKFETIEKIQAKADWNALKPRLVKPQQLSPDSNVVLLSGILTTIEAGDLLLIVGRNRDRSIKRAQPKLVLRVENELERDLTKLTLKTLTPTNTKEGSKSSIKSKSQRTDFKPLSIKFNARNIANHIIDKTWRESQLQGFVKEQGWDAAELETSMRKWAEPGPQVEVYSFQEKVGFFGNTAPLYKSLPKEMRTTTTKTQKNKAYPYDWDATGWRITIDSISGEHYTDGAQVYLERVVEGIEEDSLVIFRSADNTVRAYPIESIVEASKTGFGISAKITGLNLKGAITKEPDQIPRNFTVRQTTAHIVSELQELASVPITDELPVGVAEFELGGTVIGLSAGQKVILTGERSDAAGVIHSELLTLKDPVHFGGATTLRFKEKLKYGYKRDSVSINANVAEATHGESKSEILGSGDGALGMQRYELRNSPLTYVSANNPSGAATTLKLRVDGVLWREVPTLHRLPATERGYVTRIADDATANIQGGDGITGSRFPTGVENIAAEYRVGSGLAGHVKKDQLSLLMTQVLGVRSVTNPLPASGGDDPESISEARSNAPLTVLTLDRIVSVKDYEDFARSFSGIAKAQATVLWSDSSEILHLTVAAAEGKAVTPGTRLYDNLRQAIDRVRHPDKAIQLDTYVMRTFGVKVGIKIESAYQPESVLSNVRAAMETAFSFKKRTFGQGVTVSEVMSVIHDVDGVVAVDVDELDHKDPFANPVIPAHIAGWRQNRIAPAELLTINPHDILLDKMP